MTVAHRLVASGRGPRTLYTLAQAFRDGDQKAGWDFAMSPQIEATITTQVGVYSRYSYVCEEDLQDLRSDLRMRVMERLLDPKFTLPSYHLPRLNEAALVAYFRRAIMDLAQRAMREIAGPSRTRRNTDGTRTNTAFIVTASNLDGDDKRPTGIMEAAVDEAAVHPVEMMEKSRRLQVLAMAQRFFANDDEARMAFSALYHRSMGMEQWDEIAQAVGLGPSNGRITRGLAMRWRNVLKAALIQAGEDIGYSIMGIHTSLTDGSVCLLSSSGAMQTWTLPMLTVMSPDALANRILKVLTSEDVVTFVVLNMDDHASAMRMAALRALHYREPLVEKFDISWLEAHAVGNISGFRRYRDGKRRAMILAHAKLAECQLHSRRKSRGAA